MNKSELLQIAFDNRPILTAYAYSLVRDWSLAQDIFQEAVIAYNEKLSSEGLKNPKSWIKSVIKNKAVDLIRKQQRTEKNTEQIAFLLDKKFDSILNSEKKELLLVKEKALHSCMEKLTSDSRNILLSFYKNKFACEKIASLYKKSVNAVRLVLSRSRSELRHCIKKSLEQS